MSIKVQPCKNNIGAEISCSLKTASKEEINQITELQNKTQSVVYQLGQLKLSEMQLESRFESLKSALENIEKEETSLAEGFSKKYGVGSLNIETGEFTPTK